MKALVLDAKARTANIQDVARATPASTELLVRVKAVSLNPIDPLYVTHPLGSSGRIVGSDFAGTVVEIGSGVPSASTLRTGSRVAGFLQGACSVNKRLGAFAEYLVVPWDLVWTIPDSISAEQAAGVSLVALTAAQAIWYRLGMDAPFPYDRQQDPEPREGEPGVVNISIYGASNSVALYAAQMARLSAELNWKKIRLFGAASKARWNLLRAELHEYDALVGYRDLDWP
jgi:NADPH:quinone reductase-like Zn-dependent oxidoreductase